jgi:MFS transporter, DHA3 family, tetracycline resistance protein
MILPVELVYLIKVVGFNPLQLVLLGTLRQGMSFLFQIPTGVLADMYSRRWAVVLGMCLIGLGYLGEGAFSVPAAVFAVQVFYGLGTTLVDGADAAWAADEIGTEAVGPVYLRAAQVGSLASLVGIGLSAVFVNVGLNVPLVLGGSLFIVVSVVLAVMMPEEHFAPALREERSTFRQMGHTLRAGMRLVGLRPALLCILGVAVFSGAFSAGFDQLWNYYLLHTFAFPALGGLTSVTWFSIIEVGIVLSNLCGSSIAKRWVDTNKYRMVVIALFAVDGLGALSIVGFALAGQFYLAMGAFFLFTTAWGPRAPLQRVWMNRYLEAGIRATLFSLQGQVNALAQIVGGPVLGLIATGFGMRTAMMASAIVLVPTLVLYMLSLRNGMG